MRNWDWGGGVRGDGGGGDGKKHQLLVKCGVLTPVGEVGRYRNDRYYCDDYYDYD